MLKSHKLTGLDGLDGPLDEPLLLALLCGANKSVCHWTNFRVKTEYFSASLLYCQQIRINISHPNPPPAGAFRDFQLNPSTQPYMSQPRTIPKIPCDILIQK